MSFCMIDEGYGIYQTVLYVYMVIEGQRGEKWPCSKWEPELCL